MKTINQGGIVNVHSSVEEELCSHLWESVYSDSFDCGQSDQAKLR